MKKSLAASCWTPALPGGCTMPPTSFLRGDVAGSTQHPPKSMSRRRKKKKRRRRAMLLLSPRLVPHSCSLCKMMKVCVGDHTHTHTHTHTQTQTQTHTHTHMHTHILTH